MKKRVLLLAPSFMDIYKDIILGLEDNNMEVVWIQDGQVKGNPYNKRNINRKTKTIGEYDKYVNAIWNRYFDEFFSHAPFDYFFAIDGLMVSKYFFEELRRRYPDIKTRLYLYDRIEGNYEIEDFLGFYDEIFSFEKSDSIKYSIHHLPIYWKPALVENNDVYDIFGMASYKAGTRYEIFSKVKDAVEAEGLRANISLFYPPVKSKFFYQLKYYLKRLLGERMLPLSQLQDDIFIDKIMTPEDFRKNICQSRVVLDTHNAFQDGLTARYMWAMGAGKKIITTNSSIKSYAFYDPKQVLLLDNNYSEIGNFVKTPYSMKESTKELIKQYRIDNWVRTILGENE